MTDPAGWWQRRGSSRGKGTQQVTDAFGSLCGDLPGGHQSRGEKSREQALSIAYVPNLWGKRAF